MSARKMKPINMRFLKKPTFWIIVLAVLCAGLLSVLVFGNSNKAEYTTRTIDFGLSDIGEFATQAGYYTNVNQITKPERTIVGASIPGTASKAIMTYQGTIKAGLDFDQIQMDVDYENQIVTLKMPQPRILSNEVDMDSCEIFDVQNSIFNQIDITNYNQSITEMKERAEFQAIQNGILDSAKSNAEILIRSLFKNSNGTDGFELLFSWN